MEIKEYVDSSNYTTFKIGGQFRYFADVSSISNLNEVLKEVNKYEFPILPLGGGSNMILPDGVINVFALHVAFKGFEIKEESEEYVILKIGAGESWDGAVAYAVEMNFSGIEAMSSIPGTVGATPVQNVGAYGQGIKDTLVEVEAFDILNKKTQILSNADCKFSYRDSIFKGEAKGKYIIVSVTLKLSKIAPSTPKYPGVDKYFIDMGITNPTLKDIREAIISIRSEKLPDPRKIPNAGSIFKNPIVEKSLADKIKISYHDMPSFEAGNMIKIPAGLLIENAGLKGHNFGNISVYNKNALVLVNNGNATFADLVSTCKQIIQTVKEKFGITLEPEPEIF